MKIIGRILKYGIKYKGRFILGLIMSFLVSIFSSITMVSLKPIFDVYGQGNNKPFQLHLTTDDWELLIDGGRTIEVKKLIYFSDFYRSKTEWYENHRKESRTFSLNEKIRYIIAVGKLRVDLITIAYDPFRLIVLIALGVLPIYFLKLLCTIGTVYFLSSTGLMMVADLRTDLYNKLIDLPLSHFIAEKSGVWMSRVINDAVLISDVMVNDLRVSINNFFIIITHILLLAILSYKLLVISMIGVPLMLWPVNYFARKIKSITRNEQSRLADLNGILQEMIAGIRVIRAFGMEKYEKNRFKQMNENLAHEGFRYRLNNTIGPSIVEFTSSIIVSSLLIYGGSQIVDGHMTSGSFFTFLFTLMVILSPVKQFATWYNLMNRMTVAGQRIFELIDEKILIIDPEQPKEIKKLEDSIKFKNVSFRYESGDRDVLSNINLTLPVGSTIALVGHSGAGKSTFADLLARFQDCTRGEIFFDGIDIRDIALHSLRQKIGIVTQEVFLFNSSIQDNIAYGMQDMEIEKIKKAAQMAYAHDFIMELPQQYDTVIGERGFMLSGGQRQRISIARALLKNPEILIFDEATSALDTNSERLVQKAIKRLIKNRTTFVIAHRLSTIYESDIILVFKEGKIIEKGSHTSLLKKSGEYKKLYDMQFQKS
ncbi:MAG: ABC transporter ATP-binding protein/permease [Spirochaetia bacterium]|nr:ABC transporter ATP-binding protein/permease [Spirochaetia bacterium]